MLASAVLSSAATYRIRLIAAIVAGWLLAGLASFAVAIESLSEPLTLSEALSYATPSNPVLKLAELDLQSAQAEVDSASSSYSPLIDLHVIGERADRADHTASSSIDDSVSRLRLTQNLFDSGQRQSRNLAGMSGVDYAERRLRLQVQQQRVLIAERFFSVLLADLDYAIKNELMTIEFLHYNRLQQSFDEFSHPAEVEVLAAQSKYMDAFVVRQQAGLEPQAARRRLASAMGLDNYVPRDLAAPDIDFIANRELPEFDDLIELVLRSNIELESAKIQVSQAEHHADSEDAKYKLRVDGVIEGEDWAQKTGSRNEASVAVQFQIPVHAGAQKRRTQRLGRIEIEKAQARAKAVELRLREQAFALWHQLRTLRVESNAADVHSRYRDHYMDRSRLLYELEVRSDLGDAQAQLLNAQYRSIKAKYQVVMTWLRLDMLMGKEVVSDEN